jgi:hypothetical protein
LLIFPVLIILFKKEQFCGTIYWADNIKISPEKEKRLPYRKVLPFSGKTFERQ